MKGNPYQAYKQQSVMTMTPGEMLKMVYDGLIKELELSLDNFKKKDYNGVNKNLQKAQVIIKYLQDSLDTKYEISNNLASLYDFFSHTVLQANVKKDPSQLEEIIAMVKDLRNTYMEADRKTRSAN